MQAQGHPYLLIAICFSTFCSSFMGSSLNIAMPFMAQDYGCSPENITWMLSSFTATTAAFLLSASALADRFGYLKIFLIGTSTSAILTFAVGFTGSLLAGFVVRLIQGVTISLIFCTAMALISQRIPKEQRPFAIAYSTASVYAGLAFSPILAGLIVDTLGWQPIFFITGCLLTTSFLLARTEKNDKPLKSTMPGGRMFSSFGLGVLILLSLSYYTTDSRSLYLLILGLIGLAAYLWYEAKNADPLFPVHYIFQNKIFFYALLATLFHYLASFIYTLLLAMHLQLILGYSASHTGFLLFCQPVLMVICSSLSGKLTHLVGPQYITISGMTLCAISTFMLLLLEPNSSLVLIMTSQVLMGIGFGLFSAPNTMIVMNSVEPQRYAMASAVQSISRTVGQATSMALLTASMHYFVQAEPGTTLYVRELSHSLHVSFVCSSVAFGLGLFFCLMCLKHRIKQIKEIKALKEMASETFKAAAETAAKASAAIAELQAQQAKSAQPAPASAPAPAPTSEAAQASATEPAAKPAAEPAAETAAAPAAEPATAPAPQAQEPKAKLTAQDLQNIVDAKSSKD